MMTWGASVIRASVPGNAMDDRYWSAPGMGLSDSGIWIGSDTIYRCLAVLAALRFLGNAVATCPIGSYIKDGKKRREDLEHPTTLLLRNPNARENSFRWVRQQVMWAASFGNSYSRIVGGSRYFAEHVESLRPDQVRVLEKRSDGTLLYGYRPTQIGAMGRPVLGIEEHIGQEEMLHVRGVSADGIMGLPINQLITNVVGVALAVEKYVGSSLRKGARLSGILSKEGKLDPKQKLAVKASWEKGAGGAENSGGVAVLGDGYKFQTMQASNQEMQLVELSDATTGMILMGLGVPGVCVGYESKSAAGYASIEAYFESGGDKNTILPWVRNLESEMDWSLFLESEQAVRYFRFNMMGRERGNQTKRYASYAQGIQWGFMTRNEARALEEWNPGPSDLDDFLQPVNMAIAGDVIPPAPGQPPAQQPKKPKAPDQLPADARSAGAIVRADGSGIVTAGRRMPSPAAWLVEQREAEDIAAERAALIHANASRIAHREASAVRGGANGGRSKLVQYDGDADGLRAWAGDWYAKHAPFVAELLLLDEATAAAYCSRRLDALLTRGLDALDEAAMVEELCSLKLGD